MSNYAKEYFQQANGTEFKARFGQLRNLFGITNSKQPLTRQQWDWAKRNYTKLYHFDNNMTDFFNSVVDANAFLKYMNKVVPVGILGTTIGLTDITQPDSIHK